ncbi:hypothetical protein ACO22_02108 [Paracoccidioides brasiliensis]|uniref:Uncharacterized protein n=1 Tax=Paracoccidioides brasiliensis TaxID=121759 RepID=A0A1D2JJN7_PARBR|nr:hypothetical protein ACO22_02108 [Paracoccidioides brasiliensis]ODH46676.1 hypothetical protein GX48_07233 [Paracoccidioides brasiliensis]
MPIGRGVRRPMLMRNSNAMWLQVSSCPSSLVRGWSHCSTSGSKRVMGKRRWTVNWSIADSQQGLRERDPRSPSLFECTWVTVPVSRDRCPRPLLEGGIPDRPAR